MRYLLSLILLLSLRSELVGSDEYYRAVIAISSVLEAPDIEPSGCQCNGTGRTGDGLAKCQCGDNCDCKRGQVQSSKPVRKVESLDEVLDNSRPLRTEKTEVSESSKPVEKVETRPEEVIVREPVRTLLYFSSSNCPPCNRVAGEFTIMRKAGWRINSNSDAHIIISNEHSKYGVKAVPTFILFADGIEVDRHVGFMDRWQIAKFREQALPVASLPVYKDITIPDLKKPFERTLDTLKQMLGASYKPNPFITVTSPKRIEMSVQAGDNGTILVNFHGKQPKVSAVGVFQSDVTHMIADENKLTVYWNGVIGLLKNHITVEFE